MVAKPAVGGIQNILHQNVIIKTQHEQGIVG